MGLLGTGTWPRDERLLADAATRRRWEQIVSAMRLRRPALAAGRLARRATVRVAAAIRGREPARRDTRDEEFAPRPVRTSTAWAGTATLVVRPTTEAFTEGLPLLRRAAPSDLLGPMIDGWLRIDGARLRWFADQGTGATHAVVIEGADIAAVELVALGRRRGGLTVTTTTGEELWLLLADRRKSDGILGRLRYRS